MKENPPQGARSPGRPVGAEIRDECVAICRLIGRGMTEREIRSELGLSRDRFRARLRHMRRIAIDRRWAWVKHAAAQAAAIRQLTDIYDRALAGDRPALGVAVAAVLAQARIRKETVALGYAMGIYGPRADVADSELEGWFSRVEDDRALPRGNVFGPDGQLLDEKEPIAVDTLRAGQDT